MAGLVTEAAARLALAEGQIVHVVHAQEGVTAGDVGVEAEQLDAARDLVSNHLDRLAAHHVPAEGQVLLHATDHGSAGRLIAEYATSIQATTIVLGAPTHGGLPALMDASASQELWRHARSNILIINPDAPPVHITANGSPHGRPGRRRRLVSSCPRGTTCWPTPKGCRPSRSGPTWPPPPPLVLPPR